jgi:SAM-dependent methyltransferase
MLASRRANARRGVDESRYGREERMSAARAVARPGGAWAGGRCSGAEGVAKLAIVETDAAIGGPPYTDRVSTLERARERYREHHGSSRSADFVFGAHERPELFRRYVGGPGRRVLDLGCRTGALTRAYLDGNEVVGVDVDREALAEAAKLGIETRWADLDAPLPFEPESFDVVVAGEVLEHIRDPGRLLSDVSTVLRPGGVVVGSVPNAFRLKSRLRFLAGREPEEDPTHLHLFSPAALERLLAGFEERRLEFVTGRFVRLGPRLFANTIVFRARKPPR